MMESSAGSRSKDNMARPAAMKAMKGKEAHE